MPDLVINKNELSAACAQLAAAYFLRSVDQFDVAGIVFGTGAEELAEVIDDDSLDRELRQLAAMAPALAQATRHVACTSVEGHSELLPQSEALLSLERSADPDRARAVARALSVSKGQSVPDFNAAYAACCSIHQPNAEPVNTFNFNELSEFYGNLAAAKRAEPRLLSAWKSRHPLPIDAWRTSLRPIITALLQPHETSIGVGGSPAAHAPAAFCTPHPREPRRWTLFYRRSCNASLSRAFASALGAGLAHGLSRPQDTYVIGAICNARLASPTLWREAGLNTSDAREAARRAAVSLLRLLLRPLAYLQAGDDDVRIMAASATVAFRETDEVFAAAQWRGPYPNALGLPLPCGATSWQKLLEGTARGLLIDAQLRSSVGEDWHRAPEAAESFVETLDADFTLDAAHDVLVELLW